MVIRGSPLTTKPVATKKGENNHRGRNYRACKAVDMLKLEGVVQEMIEAGGNERDIRHCQEAIGNMLRIFQTMNPPDPGWFQGASRGKK
jgi:hypothetical protein